MSLFLLAVIPAAWYGGAGPGSAACATTSGIPRRMLPKSFEVFTQVEEHRSHAKGGLGIGLNLVQRIAELHGGSVQAQSDGPGTGPSSWCGCRSRSRIYL